MGRTRTLLGLALIVIGTIFLSRALMQPFAPSMPPMPVMPDMPSMPPMPNLPPMPDMPPLPPMPPVGHAPFWHTGAHFHPFMLVLILLLAAFWLRRRGTREQPLA